MRVVLGGETIAESDRALRVLETASPPTIYIPREDVRDDVLIEAGATCTHIASGRGTRPRARRGRRQAGATGRLVLPEAEGGLRAALGHLAFYPRRVDAAYLDDEGVTPQPGAYYGGWVTEEIEGPFKGEPGSEGW